MIENLALSKDKILTEFLNSILLGGFSAKTIANYNHTIKQFNNFIEKNGNQKEQNSYTVKNAEAYFTCGLLGKISDKKWNKFTLWTKYKNLNPFFGWCKEKGYINSNPLLEIEHKPTMPVQTPKSLNELEVKKLLIAIENLQCNYTFTKLRNIAIIYLFLYTGIRKSELLNLKITDVDLDSCSIRIEHGKGDKYREVPVREDVLKPILITYLNYRKDLNKNNQWFFNGTFGNHGNNDNKLTPSAIDILFRKLRNVLQFQVSAHRLRHTFATFLLDSTGDLYTLKELMGHSKISTTCMYLKSIRRKKKEAISALSFI